jgi:hypothetical protein
MSFKSFMDSKVKNMDWMDIALIKWSCIAFGVLLVIIFPELIYIDIYWVIAVVLILGIRPIYRAYFKK